MLIKIALRNVFRHRVRSLISMSAISFGCVCIIFMAGYIAHVYKCMAESYIKGRTGHFQIYKEGYAQNGQRRLYDYMIENSGEIRTQLEKIPHVQSVTSRVEMNALISVGGNSGPCIIQGVEVGKINSTFVSDENTVADALMETGFVLRSGREFDGTNGYQALVGVGLAQALGLQANDGLTLMLTTVHGGLNALDLIAQGIFQTSYKPFDDHTLRIPLATAQELIDTTAVHSMVVQLDENQQTNTVMAEVRDLIRKNNWQLEMKGWRELNDFYVKTEELFDHMFLVVKFVLALIVVLSIYNTLSMSVLERINEIGTLRALGSTRRRIIQLFLAESLVLGFVGSAIGVVLGSLFTLIIGHVGIPMPPPPGATMIWMSRPFVTLTGIWAAVLLSVVTAVIASIVPSFRASRLDIAEALRHCN